MGNTQFFVEAAKEHSTITWKDVFSESFVKHNKADVEYALQTGTLARQVPESHMLDTWNRPWLWWPAAKGGIGLIVLLYGVYFALVNAVGGISMSFGNMMMIIPPLIIPMVIMIFMWELNIPQNISIMDLMAFFIVGAVANFALNSLMFLVIPNGPASYAALREEPAKMAASLLILLYIEKVQKKKIYGLTGLVVGAAVGAAFSGIESVSYAINNSESVELLIFVQVFRSLFALGGHFAYCIPYATAIALNLDNGKIGWKSVFNPMTLGAMAFSVACHWIWNSGSGLFVQVVLLVVSVFVLRYWMKKALQQIVKICAGKRQKPVPVAHAGNKLVLVCNSTSLQGMTWEIGAEAALVGRQANVCKVCFESNTPGVSRQHCKIFQAQNGWYIQDLNSTYGTYVGGQRLAPFAACQIQSGVDIHLGSKKVWLTVK